MKALFRVRCEQRRQIQMHSGLLVLLGLQLFLDKTRILNFRVLLWILTRWISVIAVEMWD